MNNINLSDSGEVNEYGHPMAACVKTYDPLDDPKQDKYPVNLDGEELDTYCNHIDSTLGELLDPLTDLAPNHRSGLAFNPGAIPSDTQREAFLLMRSLLENAHSLAGTLRYDIAVKHDDCPEHDEHARRKIDRIKERLCK